MEECTGVIYQVSGVVRDFELTDGGDGAALWSGLPSEVQERALSYLSAPVLCRFRAHGVQEMELWLLHDLCAA